jgi:hypothetical protein
MCFLLKILHFFCLANTRGLYPPTNCKWVIPLHQPPLPIPPCAHVCLSSNRVPNIPGLRFKGKKRVKEATAFGKEFYEITVQLEFPDSERSLEDKRLLNTPPLKETVKKFFRGRNFNMV